VELAALISMARAHGKHPGLRQPVAESARIYDGFITAEMAMFLKCPMATVAAISSSVFSSVFLGAVLGIAAVTPGRAADLPDGYGRSGYSQPAERATSCLHAYNGLPVSFGYGLCYQRELLPTPWGPRWRLVNHCC
jgi:hypothetical protein